MAKLDLAAISMEPVDQERSLSRSLSSTYAPSYSSCASPTSVTGMPSRRKKNRSLEERLSDADALFDEHA